MSVTLPERLRNLTRKQILIGGSVAVPVLAVGLGLMAAPKLDEREPMQPVSQERMQILVNANQPAPPPMMAVNGRLEVLPPGAAAAAAPPRPVQVAYRAPAAADYGRDAYAVTAEDNREPEVIRGPGRRDDEARYREDERYDDRDDNRGPPPEDEEPPAEAPDEQY